MTTRHALRLILLSGLLCFTVTFTTCAGINLGARATRTR